MFFLNTPEPERRHHCLYTYADLGLPDAAEMQVKAGLAMQTASTIRERGLKQQAAASLVGMQQPKLSELLRGNFRGISQAKMIECLNRLGHDVEIVVRKAPGDIGATLVVTAD